MRIVVQLTPGAARQVRAPEARGVKHRPLGWLEHSLKPIHPRSSGSTLDTFFEVEIGDPAEAARVLEQLQNDPAVDAAYVKPDDELPSM
jgi:hypothetical protein